MGCNALPWVDRRLTPTLQGRNTVHRLILMNGRKLLVINPGRGLTSASTYFILHRRSLPLISVIVSGIFANSRNTTQIHASHKLIPSFAVPMVPSRLDTARTSGPEVQALSRRASTSGSLSRPISARPKGRGGQIRRVFLDRFRWFNVMAH